MDSILFPFWHAGLAQPAFAPKKELRINADKSAIRHLINVKTDPPLSTVSPIDDKGDRLTVP